MAVSSVEPSEPMMICRRSNFKAVYTGDDVDNLTDRVSWQLPGWCPMAPLNAVQVCARDGSRCGPFVGTSIAEVRAVGAFKNVRERVWDWPRGGAGRVVVVRSAADVASGANSKNTWFYDLVPREVGGTRVTARSRLERFEDPR